MNIEVRENVNDSKLLKKKKESILKKYSPTKSKTIEAANHLAVYLWSLNRVSEALALLRSYSEKSPFEKTRLERWEASCFAMLLQSHLEKRGGNLVEHERLLDNVNNESFTPSDWIDKNKYDEFASSIESDLDNLEGITKGEKAQVRVGGYLVSLSAYYIWSQKSDSFKENLCSLEQIMSIELEKIKAYIE